MLRTFISLLFVLFVASNLWAQDNLTRFDFFVAPTISWMSILDDSNIRGSGSNFGFKFGGDVEFYFNDKAAITTGLALAYNQGGTLLYEQGGSFFPDSQDNLDPEVVDLPDDAKVKYKISYVEFPLSLKVLTDEILSMQGMRFFLHFPEFHFAIKSKTVADISGLSGTSGGDTFNKQNITKDMAAFNILWGLGAGAEYNLQGTDQAGTSVFFSIHYGQGFLDLTENEGTYNDGTKEDSTSRLHRLEFKAGISF